MDQHHARFYQNPLSESGVIKLRKIPLRLDRPGKIELTLTENLLTIFKIYFSFISPKPFSHNFLCIFKFSENCPKTSKEFAKKYEFYEMHISEIYNFP